MTKKQRAEVFAKTGGKCGYCGCELDKTWHVDHMLPILRNRVYMPPMYRHHITGVKISQTEYWQLPRESYWEYTKQGGKMVADGTCAHLERDTMENYLPACASCNINKGGADVETFRYCIENGVQSMHKQHAQYRMGKRFGLIVEIDKPVIFYFETLTK